MDKLDIKLWTLASKGQIVPDRSLLKTPEQIEMIKKSAALNTAVLDHVAAHIHAGMSTAEIDKLVYDFTTEHGGIPAPLNYEGFPKSVCTSINNVICHGIPSEHEILIDGDIINVDVSTILNGYFSDASRMFTIGEVSPEAERIVRVTKECVELGLKAAKPWGHLGVDSGLLNLDGCLKIGQVLGAKLTKTSDSLCPLTADNVEGFKSDDDLAAEEAPAEEEVPAEAAPVASVQGAVTTIKHGKVVISIKEGKDIYLELPI